MLEQLSKVLACDGFEFMMYRSWYEKADEIIEDLKNMNLKFPVMHCEKGIGELISRNEKWEYDHVSHYHINDYNGGYMEWGKLKTLPIEYGNIDFERFFSFIRRIGYDDTFTVEATAFNGEGIVDTDMLNNCFEKIRGYVSK